MIPCSPSWYVGGSSRIASAKYALPGGTPEPSLGQPISMPIAITSRYWIYHSVRSWPAREAGFLYIRSKLSENARGSRKCCVMPMREMKRLKNLNDSDLGSRGGNALFAARSEDRCHSPGWLRSATSKGRDDPSGDADTPFLWVAWSRTIDLIRDSNAGPATMSVPAEMVSLSVAVYMVQSGPTWREDCVALFLNIYSHLDFLFDTGRRARHRGHSVAGCRGFCYDTSPSMSGG